MTASAGAVDLLRRTQSPVPGECRRSPDLGLGIVHEVREDPVVAVWLEAEFAPDGDVLVADAVAPLDLELEDRRLGRCHRTTPFTIRLHTQKARRLWIAGARRHREDRSGR